MSALTTSETLNLAADLIEERGWTYGSGWPTGEGDTTPLCLEGGLMAALGMTFEDADNKNFWNACPAYRAVAEHLAFTAGFLYHWNDRKDRTQAEVVEVLRATAVIESAREVRTTLAGLPGSEVSA